MPERIFTRTIKVGHMQIGWRTVTFAFAVLGGIALIAGPIKANHEAIETGCKNLTSAIRASQGVPAKRDVRGQPVPTPSAVLVRVLLRSATPKDFADLKRAYKAYPPLKKAACDNS